MIKSITLKNIQAHKDTTLEFHKGINSIIGTSNNGKTSIIRALNWNRYNRPLGIDTLASHWIMNEDGTLKEEMSVTVENDNHTITRKRTKKDNQYIVDGEIQNVVKTDVPVSVENALRLTETNIQNQQDAPFLLSETSGKVAEYFNRVVRLDIIDRVLTKAETTRRKTNQEIQSLENTIKENENKLEDFNWLDNVEKLLDKIERVTVKNTQIKQLEQELSNSITNYKNHLCNQRDLTDSKEILKHIEQETKDNKELQEQYEELELQIEKYNSCKTYPSFSKQKEVMKKIEKELNYQEHLQNEVNHISTLIENYKYYLKQIKDKKLEITELKKQLPEVCPICGSRMKDGKCIED